MDRLFGFANPRSTTFDSVSVTTIFLNNPSEIKKKPVLKFLKLNLKILSLIICSKKKINPYDGASNQLWKKTYKQKIVFKFDFL